MHFFMNDMALLYILWSILVVFIVLLVVIWLENIIKIVLGNYILGTMCFAASEGIKSLVVHLNSLVDVSFAWIATDTWAAFFANGHATIILLMYILLLIVLYKKSTISIRLPHDMAIQKSLYIVLIPLALTSLIITLYLIFWWAGIVSPDIVSNRFSQWWVGALIAQLLYLTPLWICIHGLATILITSEMSVRVETDMGDFGDI